MCFVATAMQLSPLAYSLHKTTTRDVRRGVFVCQTHSIDVQYLITSGARKVHASAEAMATMHFDLPATMRVHKRNCVDVEVDVIRWQRNDGTQTNTKQASKSKKGGNVRRKKR